jgi:hypothetical protein
MPRMMVMTVMAVVAATGFSGNEKVVLPAGKGEMVVHDFNGVKRLARAYELKWKKGATENVFISLGEVDMLDDYPTIDFLVDAGAVKGVGGRYFGKLRLGQSLDTMTETFSKTGGVTCIHREIGHCPRWASWMDVRKVGGLQIGFSCDGWSDSNAVQRVWISDVRFTKDDSWRGTERDRAYREWLDFCDHYEPDLSDSAKYLEPPEEGRLKRPIKLVDVGRACAEIVAPKDFYNSLELAARDLQHWVRKMSGAELPIVKRPTGKVPVRIFLNDPGAQRRWKEDVEWLKGGKDIDGYFIHTDGNDIHIGCAVPNDASWKEMSALGLPFDACPVGVFRGVVAFLENNSTILFASTDKELGTVYDGPADGDELGGADFIVRWGEGRSRPATCGRGWLGGNGASPLDIDGYALWNARNKGNVWLPHRISGHANRAGEMIEFVPNTEPYQVFDGKKRIKHGYYSGQICLGAPDTLDIAISNGIRKVERCFAERYPVASIGFWNEDNWRVCVCPACTKPIVGDDGTVLTSNGKTSPDAMAASEGVYRSTQYMQFANGLADGIAAKHPGVKTEILAYLFQRTTPKCAISSNVAWTYCPWHCRWSYGTPMFHPANRHVFDEFTLSLAKGGEMRVYDYHAFCAGGVTTMAEAAAADYRWYSDHGIKMTGAEYASIGNPKEPLAMMNAWLFNQVGWDADCRKVEKLRKYYLSRLYREGAPAAELYFAYPRRWALNRPERGATGCWVRSSLPKDEAQKIFDRYLGKITNPTALEHYKILMKKAVGDK